jgi:uncharacterized membrane protein YgdD (TMEM256/DUF423 family)
MGVMRFCGAMVMLLSAAVLWGVVGPFALVTFVGGLALFLVANYEEGEEEKKNG